jgi:hypothetical protein
MDIFFLIIFLMLFIIMLLVGVLVIGYVWLTPVMPYLRAKWSRRDVLFVIGKDNKIRLIPAKYSSMVFSSSAPPFTYLQRVPRAYRLGDVNVVLVDDAWGVVIDPDMNEALNVLAQHGITNYTQLRDAVEKRRNKVSLGSEDVDKIVDIVEIHAFKEIPIHNVLQYVGNVTGGELKAYVDEKMAEFVEQYRKLGEDKKGGIGMTWIIVIILMFMIGGFFLMKFLGIM